MKYKYKIIFFIILAAVTFACHFYVEQYEKNGPEILTDLWEINVPEGNTGKVEENRLFLYSSDPAKSVNIQQDISPFQAGTILHLSADMKCRNVIPGEKPWNRARLLLVQNDGKIDRWDSQHSLAAIDGTGGWESYRATFIVQPETAHTRVEAQLSRCTGAFELRNIHLYPVVQTQLYGWVQKSILVLWAVFGVFLLCSCFVAGENTVMLRILLGISLVAIVVGTSMPSEIKTQVSQEVSGQIEENSALLAQVLPVDLSKIGHFVFFALFGMILSRMMPQTSFVIVLGHILMVAGGTELAQFYIDGRSPLLDDFFIDMAGGVSGIVFVLLFGIVFSNRRDHSGFNQSH